MQTNILTMRARKNPHLTCYFMAFGTGSGGSGSGDSKWMDNVSGPNPGDIELNTPDGVTGVYAPNPFDVRFIQLLTQLAGVNYAGNALLESADETWLNIIQQSVGNPEILQEYINNATGRDIYRQLAKANIVDAVIDGDTVAQKEVNIAELNEFAEDTSTGEKNQHTIHPDYDVVKAIVAGVEVLRRWVTADEFLLDDEAGNRKFAILVDGKIQTNQIGPVGALTPNGDAFEMFDETGVSRGFVLLNS